MKPLLFDPLRLDVRAFARAGAELGGQWPLSGFARLGASLMAAAEGTVPGEVRWAARGEQRTERGGAAQTWLHLSAQALLPMACQRCLGRTEETLAVERAYRFVADEATAQALDGEVEHEVLVVARELDLHALLEDELLLDLPLVPRHEVCPQPLTGAPEQPAPSASADHPFAALAKLKGAERPPQ